jgi:hypothetical protein
MKCLSAIALVILGGLLQLASVKAEEPLQSVRYGTWGFDISGENAAIKPGDDFFEFTNGGWLDRTAIPADKIGMSVDVLINDRTEAQLHSSAILTAKAVRAETATIIGPYRGEHGPKCQRTST